MSHVSRETLTKLSDFKELVSEENLVQNLVSPASLADFDIRHIDDAVQLVDLAREGSWCDIGSGAGLPGIVIAIMTGAPMTLVEPRRLRAQFLRRAVLALSVECTVVEAKVERLTGKFDNLTARAVAKTSRIFDMAQHLTHSGTRWVLPKGRSAQKELDAARQSWQGSFTLVPSRTSFEAMILVAEHVRRRGAG